jgi:hypothetical protein
MPLPFYPSFPFYLHFYYPLFALLFLSFYLPFLLLVKEEYQKLAR